MCVQSSYTRPAARNDGGRLGQECNSLLRTRVRMQEEQMKSKENGVLQQLSCSYSLVALSHSSSLSSCHHCISPVLVFKGLFVFGAFVSLSGHNRVLLWQQDSLRSIFDSLCLRVHSVQSPIGRQNFCTNRWSQQV